MSVYPCKNCDGKLVFRKRSGWGHVIATGCVNPSVTLTVWKSYLKNRRSQGRRKPRRKTKRKRKPKRVKQAKLFSYPDSVWKVRK